MTAETLILGTNKCQDAYRTWLVLPPLNRMYANLKTHFNAEFQLQNTLNTTTRDAGYHQMNHVEDAQQQTIEEAVQNFAVANEANSEVFATLMNTNQELNALVQAFTNANTQLQAQMTSMNYQMTFMTLNQNMQNNKGPRFINKINKRKKVKGNYNNYIQHNNAGYSPKYFPQQPFYYAPNNMQQSQGQHNGYTPMYQSTPPTFQSSPPGFCLPVNTGYAQQQQMTFQHTQSGYNPNNK
eukprot:4054812-Ditylum_brightwellii.AAC.1